MGTTPSIGMHTPCSKVPETRTWIPLGGCYLPTIHDAHEDSPPELQSSEISEVCLAAAAWRPCDPPICTHRSGGHTHSGNTANTHSHLGWTLTCSQENPEPWLQALFFPCCNPVLTLSTSMFFFAQSLPSSGRTTPLGTGVHASAPVAPTRGCRK